MVVTLPDNSKGAVDNTAAQSTSSGEPSVTQPDTTTASPVVPTATPSVGGKGRGTKGRNRGAVALRSLPFIVAYAALVVMFIDNLEPLLFFTGVIIACLGIVCRFLPPKRESSSKEPAVRPSILEHRELVAAVLVLRLGAENGGKVCYLLSGKRVYVIYYTGSIFLLWTYRPASPRSKTRYNAGAAWTSSEEPHLTHRGR